MRGRAPARATGSSSSTSRRRARTLRRGGRRHPRRPGARAAGRPHRRRARGARRVRLLPQRDLLHTDASVLPAARRARASWNYLLAGCAVDAGGGAGQLRHEPAAAASTSRVDYLVTLNAGDRVDADAVLAPDGLRAPGLHRRTRSPRSGALPELNDGRSRSPAPTTAGASTRTAAPPACARPRVAGGRRGERPALYRTARPRTVRTERRCATPSRYRHAYVAGRPRRRARSCAAAAPRSCGAVRRAPTTSATRRSSLRANVDAFLGRHGVDLDGGRVLMLANAARRSGYVFNPLSVFWCYDRRRRARLRRRRGAQHLRRAALLPAAARRARPGRGRQEVLRLAVLRGRRPLPDALPEPGRPRAAGRRSRLRRDGDTSRLHRHRGGHAATAATPAFLAGAAPSPAVACGSSALIRLQGIRLWLRRLPVVPRPPRHRAGGSVTRVTADAPARSPTGSRRPAGPWQDARRRRPRPRLRCTPPSPAPVPPGRGPRCRCGCGCPTAGSSAAAGPTRPADALSGRDAFFRRLGADGLIGFGEAYMAGDWDADDLAACSTPFAARMAEAGAPRAAAAAPLVRAPPARRASSNTRPDARRNIARHYDLSNDLFALFLDPTMTYSSALFDADRRRPLDAARPAPQDRPAARRHRGRRPARTAAGDRHRLGRARGRGPRGAAPRVTTLTLSERAAGAGPRAGRGGRGGRAGSTSSCATTATVDGPLRRGRQRRDDRGRRRPSTGRRTSRTLDRAAGARRPGRLQAITIAHDRMLATRDTYTWIHKYMFPGGAAPVGAGDRATSSPTHHACASSDRRRFGAALRRDAARVAGALRRATPTEVDALGFDAHLPPDVGLLPRLLRGRVRLRLPRRRARSSWRTGT